MKLDKRIKDDFIEAYKARNLDKKNFLGVLKGAIETNQGKGIESTDENVLKLVKSMEKGLSETLKSKKTLNLDYSIQEIELGYLSPYLPTLMSENEIRQLIQVIISNNDNTNIGFLIGLFNKENKGKGFDNKLVGQIINELLLIKNEN